MPATLSLLVSVFTDARERATGDRHLGGDRGPRRRARPGRRRLPARPLLVGLDLHRQRPADRDRAGRRARGSSRSRATRSRGGSTGRAPPSPAPAWSRSSGRSSRRRRRAGRPRRCSAPARSPRSRWSRSWCWQRRVAEPLLDVRLFADPRFTAASSTIMVLFFALFGFLFLSTQYLQFVLGYSPSAAGVRVLPYAGRDDRVRAARPRSSSRASAPSASSTAGMLLFAAGLAVAATHHARAPATAGSPSRCCSWARAWASRARRRPSRSWARSRPSGRTSGRPSTTRRASSAARSASRSSGSIMSSLHHGPSSPTASRRAREAFVHAMSRASLVVAVVAALGALIAWRYLPAVAKTDTPEEPLSISGSPVRL